MYRPLAFHKQAPGGPENVLSGILVETMRTPVLSMQFDPLAREKHAWLPALVPQWYKRKKTREFISGHARSYVA